jgi:hypothetical protein
MSYKFIQNLYSAVGSHEDLDSIAGNSAWRRLNFTRQTIRQIGYIGCNVLEIGPASGFITKMLSEEIIKKDGLLSVMDFSPSFLKN